VRAEVGGGEWESRRGSVKGKRTKGEKDYEGGGEGGDGGGRVIGRGEVMKTEGERGGTEKMRSSGEGRGG